MVIEQLANDARKIWGNEVMSLDHITLAIGVIYGDICRQARNQKEQQRINETELKKELGNLIFSTIRWCNDLGYSPKECIELAREAQVQYVAKHEN